MLARTKQANPLTLTQRIRLAADKVRALDVELKDIIEAYVDEQKASQDGRDLPRETLRQLFMNKHDQPWFAILALEAERAHE